MLAIAATLTFFLTAIMAMAGVGAAFILVPIFMALGVDIHAAMATALLLNAISTSVSTATFIRKRLVDWRLLLWLFSGFLVFAGVMMLTYSPRASAAVASARAQRVRGSLIGGVAGFVGGLLGVGGGSIIVPALVGSGLEPKRASATASFVIVFASLTGFLAHATLAGVDYRLVGSTALASACGAALGAWLMSEKLKSGQLKYVIGVVLLGTAVKMIWGLLS